jgi:hypothetical protein
MIYYHAQADKSPVMERKAEDNLKTMIERRATTLKRVDLQKVIKFVFKKCYKMHISSSNLVQQSE